MSAIEELEAVRAAHKTALPGEPVVDLPIDSVLVLDGGKRLVMPMDRFIAVIVETLKR